MRSEVVVTGGESGESNYDCRGRRVMEMDARVDLVILNEGVPTFGHRGTIPPSIHITMCMEEVVGELETGGSYRIIRPVTTSISNQMLLRII